MLPPLSDFLAHPVTSVRQLAHVVRLNEMHNAAIVQAKRQRRVDDVEKRVIYRRAHGLPEEQGIGGWFGKGDKAAEAAEAAPAAAVDDASPVKPESS